MAGRKSATKSKGGKGRKAGDTSITQHERAGLIFPVGKFGTKLRNGQYTKRTGKSSAIMMAGVIEYLCAEIMEMAGNCCEQDGRKRITPKHL
jgi:histone H2A